MIKMCYFEGTFVDEIVMTELINFFNDLFFTTF